MKVNGFRFPSTHFLSSHKIVLLQNMYSSIKINARKVTASQNRTDFKTSQG